MSFRDAACKHLANYRVKDLNEKEEGLFFYRGKGHPTPHLLPINNYKNNILEKYRDQFWSSDDANKIKLHRYFHHLNSSQALCINLFFPLKYENLLGKFIEHLDLEHETCMYADAEFEKESEIERAERKTSFDFYLKLASAKQIFVEVKYTENGFGKAKLDENHRNKFHETYLPLIDKSKFLNPQCRDEKIFLDHYQILRNLVHISSTNLVVLLFPKANILVKGEADKARDHLLNDEGRARLKIVFLEDFVSDLERQCRHNQLDGYFQDFRTKYLPPFGRPAGESA